MVIVSFFSDGSWQGGNVGAEEVDVEMEFLFHDVKLKRKMTCLGHVLNP